MSEKVRALLKISGETLSGQGLTESGFGISGASLKSIVLEIQSAREILNLALAIVIGGGNIMRGKNLKEDVFGEDTAVADEMGMLATIINCICLKKVLKQHGVESRVMSALECNKVCEPYLREVALSHLEKGRVVILAGGMGRPNHSTDMAMVMLAKELEMTMVLKGTKVNGIYTEDPTTDDLTTSNPNAKFISKINHDDYLELDLKVVDFSAVAFAREKGIRINVFSFFKEDNFRRILSGEDIGSVIYPAE